MNRADSTGRTRLGTLLTPGTDSSRRQASVWNDNLRSAPRPYLGIELAASENRATVATRALRESVGGGKMADEAETSQRAAPVWTSVVGDQAWLSSHYKSFR